ncbi:MAG: hypothetical protein ACKN85_17705, partial [Pirellula sp.]
LNRVNTMRLLISLFCVAQLLDGIKPIATFGSFCAVARHAMLKEDWSHVLAEGYRVLSRESLKAHHGQLGDTKQGYQQSHRVDSV